MVPMVMVVVMIITMKMAQDEDYGVEDDDCSTSR